MKTNTKFLTGAIALFAISILISSFKKPEETTKEYLTVAFTRTNWEAYMTVIPRDGLPDEEEIAGGLKKDALISNAVKVNSMLNSAAKKGYKLVSTINDNTAVSGMTIFIFEKN